MEHEEAIRSLAAERYVTRELAQSERDAFESHFFDCPECAAEVRWELAFKANARAALGAREKLPRPAAWETWLAWLHPRRALTFSLAGNACLVFGCLLLVVGNRHWAGPQVLPAFFAPGPTRSAEIETRLIPPGVSAFIARLPADPSLEPVSVQIFDEAGKRAVAGTVAPTTGQDGEWFLEVPVKGLPEAAYTLVVSGAEDRILTRFRFRTSR